MRGGCGHGRPQFCQRPFERLRHVEGAGFKSSGHDTKLLGGVCVGGLGGQRIGRAAGLCGALGVCVVARGLGQGGLARAEFWASRFGAGGGHDAAFGIRFAARVAAGSCACAAGDTARCGRPKTLERGRMDIGCAGFCGVAGRCQSRPVFGLDCRGRFCRSCGGFCLGGLGGGQRLALGGERRHRPAVAGFGHAAAHGAPRVCGGAGQQFGGGLAGPDVAGVAAHRFGQRLAASHTGRCTQSLCDQHPARPRGGLSRGFSTGWRAALRLVPHDPCAFGHGQRQSRHPARLCRRARAPAGGPRIQCVLQRAVTP